MKMPWQKDVPQGETEEQKKKREEEEQTAFFGKIGELVKNELKPVNETITDLQGRWKKLEDAAAHDDDAAGDDDLSEEEKRRKAEGLEKGKLLALAIATNARITENEVLQEVRDRFPEFEAKVKEYFAGTALERKGLQDYPLYCRNIVKMVVGDAALSGGLRYDSTGKRFWLEDTKGGDGKENYDFLAGDVSWVDPRSNKVMTGREQLAKLGITPEEFAESQKKGIV